MRTGGSGSRRGLRSQSATSSSEANSASSFVRRNMKSSGKRCGFRFTVSFQAFRRNLVDFREMAVKHDLVATDQENVLFEDFKRNNLQRTGLSRHREGTSASVEMVTARDRNSCLLPKDEVFDQTDSLSTKASHTAKCTQRSFWRSPEGWRPDQGGPRQNSMSKSAV